MGTIGGKCPGTNMGDAVGERIDVAVGPVGIGYLLCEPVVGDGSIAGEKAKYRSDHLGVIGQDYFTIIRNLANIS